MNDAPFLAGHSSLAIGTVIDGEISSIQLNFINNNWNYGVVVIHPYIDEPMTKVVDYDDSINILFTYDEFEYIIDVTIENGNYVINYKEKTSEKGN